MSEIQKFLERMAKKQKEGMVHFSITVGPGWEKLTPEERAEQLNHIMDQTDGPNAKRHWDLKELDAEMHRTQRHTIWNENLPKHDLTEILK